MSGTSIMTKCICSVCCNNLNNIKSLLLLKNIGKHYRYLIVLKISNIYSFSGIYSTILIISKMWQAFECDFEVFAFFSAVWGNHCTYLLIVKVCFLFFKGNGGKQRMKNPIFSVKCISKILLYMLRKETISACSEIIY